jgi:hypothetical protein
MMIRTIPLFALALLVTGCVAASSGVEDDGVGAGDDALSATLSSLETSGGWTSCSLSGTNCGGKNGQGAVVDSTFTTGTFGGRAHAARISISGGVRYGEAYWYKKMPGLAYQIESLEVSTDVYIAPGASYQAIEWDPQQVRDQHVFNFGWQAENAGGKWRVYDYASHAWQDSGIPLGTLTEGVWHTMRAHYHTAGATIFYDWLEIDGVRHVPTQNVQHQSAFEAKYTNGDVSLGLQLDQKSSGASYSVYYDNVTMQYADGASSGGGGCAAPAILEPSLDEAVGPAIHLRVSAPSCLDAVKCYLDGKPTPVASAAGAIDQWVSVAVGEHEIQCNGWDAKGTVHASPAIAFDRAP